MKRDQEIKTVIILAAGSGKRLDIFETPKPLVRLGNKALIVHTIDMFKRNGVDKFYIVIKKDDKLIKKELIDYNNIKYIEKDNNGGMLGSILAIQKKIDKKEIKDDFYVSMCDLYFSNDPLKLFNKNKYNGISVLVSDDKNCNLNSGAQEKVVLLKDKISYENDAKENVFAQEAGIYRFTINSYNDFVKTINKNTKKTSEVFKLYSKKNKIFPIVMRDNIWFDINTPVDLVRAELFLKNKLVQKKESNINISKYKKIKPIITYKYEKKIEYDVIVERGIIDKIAEYEIIPHEHYYSPHYVIVDKNIDKLYGDKIYKQFKKMGYRINKILVDPGESTKSIEVYSRLADEMVTSGIDKKSIIISVGGGVVKDLAGFLASTIYRGINLISFPTTVLSQSDAAIALKQGVNGKLGKNLFGSYFSPLKVILDPLTLLTLEDRYIYDGLAECLKQSFAQDIEFFDLFNNYNGKIKDIDFLEKVVTRAAILKVESTSRDYNEENIALVNQYGHEFGHAIEYLSGYKLLHGESVAVGMRVSSELSKILGISDDDVVKKHISLLQKYKLPVCVPKNIKAKDILNSLKFSKKFHGNKARFVLVDKIGSIWHDEDYYFATCSDEIITEAINNSYTV